MIWPFLYWLAHSDFEDYSLAYIVTGPLLYFLRYGGHQVINNLAKITDLRDTRGYEGEIAKPVYFIFRFQQMNDLRLVATYFETLSLAFLAQRL